MSTLFRTGPTTEHVSRLVYGIRQRSITVPPSSHHVKERKEHPAAPLTTESMRLDFYEIGGFSSPGLRVARSATFGHQQLRFAHTEVTFPNMENYRRDSTKDNTKHAIESEDQRRSFTTISTLVAGIVSLYTAKSLVHKVVEYKQPGKDKLALATVEIDISNVPEGKSQTFMWRGKPVFVRHRSAEEVERERAVDVNSLRHPQHDTVRAPFKPEWVVMIGVCTHLGCIPIAGMGDYGGYYCPCHGSHYDSGGRIRKGPAPLNLEIPAHKFKDDNTVIVGAS